MFANLQGDNVIIAGKTKDRHQVLAILKRANVILAAAPDIQFYRVNDWAPPR
jgi:hypothetical protein